MASSAVEDTDRLGDVDRPLCMTLEAAISEMLPQTAGNEAENSMTHYVIRVAGQLSDDLLTAFPLLVATTEVTTVLQGRLPDQAALTGVIDRLDELGINILAVVTLPEAAAAERPWPRR